MEKIYWPDITLCMSYSTQSDDQQRFSKVGLIWLFVQIAACVINLALLQWDVTNGWVFFVLVPASISAVQILVTSALLRRIKWRNGAICMLLGALLDFIMPIVLCLLVAWSPQFSDLNAVVAWVIIGCWIPLLGGGLIGGAWLGYLRWKMLTTYSE